MMFASLAASGRYQQTLVKNRTVFALLSKSFSTDQQPPSAKLVK